LAYKINVTGTEFLFDILTDKGVKVLFFSSAAVYGNSQRPLIEDDSLNGKSIYALTKKHMEQKFRNNPQVKILRPSLVITNNDKFIQYIRNCLSEKKEAEIFSDILMTPIGIVDIVNIVVRIMADWENTPDLLNLCGIEHLYKEDIARIYKKYVNNAFCYRVVAPPEEYLNGRDTSLPLSADKLLAFYRKKLTCMKDVIMKEYTN
jgi:dTDP-4-dehydrorhamnose reductase